MIEITKYSELSLQTKNQLNSYIEEDFGQIPIVIKTEWAVPDWAIIYYDNEQIVTFYNIVEREITIDNKKFRIGGINNVITPKEFRGMGFASKVLRETESLIFDDLNVELGVLLCADSLIPFYERLNWYCVDCPVYFQQSSGKMLWSANTMLLTKKGKIRPNSIQLNGLPW